MRKIICIFIAILLAGQCATGQGASTSKTGSVSADGLDFTTPTALDSTAEEAAQLKEITAQRAERQKEAKSAGEAIAQAKTDEDAIKFTLRFQLANERLVTLQLVEMLTVANAKIRLNCLDCEYKGGTLAKPEAVKK